MRYFPLEPLLEYLRSHYPDSLGPPMGEESQVRPNPWDICGRPGHAGRQWWMRLLKAGRLVEAVADAVGVELAGHPSLIWPEWFEEEACV